MAKTKVIKPPVETQAALPNEDTTSSPVTVERLRMKQGGSFKGASGNQYRFEPNEVIEITKGDAAHIDPTDYEKVPITTPLGVPLPPKKKYPPAAMPKAFNDPSTF